MAYENILVEGRGRVGLITLSRPKGLNALSPELMRELGDRLCLRRQHRCHRHNLQRESLRRGR
jgi:enoyl-CoA hydratase/carnithine racemase